MNKCSLFDMDFAKIIEDAFGVSVDRLRELVQADKKGRHGRWIENTFCSCCGGFDEDDEGNIIQSFHNYCPNCGARMDKEDEQDK